MALDQNTLAYLARAFDRAREQAVSSAGQARLRVMAEATKAGALHGRRMLLNVKGEYERELIEATDRAVRLAFDATGSTSDALCHVVQRALFAIRDALSNDLAQFFRAQAAWAGNLGEQLGNDFLNATDKRIAGAVDDLRHCILGGHRLTKDPLVSVISTVTNS